MENKKIKRIIIEVPVIETDERLEFFVKEWVKDNFWNKENAKIKIEDVEDEKE